MMSLESVVRPFVSTPIAPPSGPLGNLKNPNVVNCSLGGKGGRSVPWTLSGSNKVLKSQTEKYLESSRDTVKRRVENPDDSSQFVEFCQTKRLKLTRDKGVDNPRTSSYDLTGGYHDLSGGADSSPQNIRDYSFKVPEKTKECKNADKSSERGCAFGPE